MGIRVRGLIAGVVLTILFVTITFLSPNTSISRFRNAAAESDVEKNLHQPSEIVPTDGDTITPPETIVPDVQSQQTTANSQSDTHSDSQTGNSQSHPQSETSAHPHPELHSNEVTYSHSSNEFRLLIGVMSPFWGSARRHIIRDAYNRFPKGLPVDVVFVQGNMTTEHQDNEEKVLATQRRVVSWENETYHDIMMVDCKENLVYGKTYEYFKKVGREFAGRYTHVMKTDDDSFVNIPALVEVLKANKDQEHFYWGTTWTQPDRQHEEMWGSGYILSMDLVEWISTSDIPPQNTWGFEDYQVCYWLIEGGLDDNFVVNRTAFAGYPWPWLGEYEYKQENEIRPFDRWTLVTHPLKEDFMWVDTAEYYLGLEW